MEQTGYIYKEKTMVSGGKRAFKIFLTEKGRAKGKEIMDFTNHIDAISLNGFTEKEIDLFYAMLKKVTDNLNQYQEHNIVI